MLTIVPYQGPMLAPRKKLWSTPIEAIQKAIECLNLTGDDIVYDIGAGDGRFIISAASSSEAICIGIEIDKQRVDDIQIHIDDIFGLEYDRCSVIHGNALEIDLTPATAFFLYLVPRGLRIILPIIKNIAKKKNIRIVSFMNPLPDLEPLEVHKISPSTQPDAQWPLFVYKLTNDS